MIAPAIVYKHFESNKSVPLRAVVLTNPNNTAATRHPRPPKSYFAAPTPFHRRAITGWGERLWRQEL